MRSILILNAKGGSGKTTVATNLAGYYADAGAKVVLADYDPLGGSVDEYSQCLTTMKPALDALLEHVNKRLTEPDP